MKKFLFLFIASTLTFLPSCKEEDDVIWDWNPVSLSVEVTNSNGENLLDPKTEGNILDSEMYIVNEGIQYPVTIGWPLPEGYNNNSRAIPAIWYGAFIAPTFQPDDITIKPERYSENKIFIGEFSGSHSYETDVELVIDGKSYTLSFAVKMDYKKPMSLRDFYFEGKKLENSVYKIVL